MNDVNRLEDDRAEIFPLLSEFKNDTYTDLPKLDRNARSVVLVVRKRDLRHYGTDKDGDIYCLTSKKLKDRKVVTGTEKLSFDEKIKLANQRSANALGTGFLYKKDASVYVVTAGHVIFPTFLDIDLEDIRFVQNYCIDKNKNYENKIIIHEKDVLRPKRQLLEKEKNFELSTGGKDYAIVEIESKEGLKASCLTSKNISSIRENKVQEDNANGNEKVHEEAQHVYGLGHGFGLPLKFSPCGKILKPAPVLHEELFNCELDFFSGNSGSPVFDTETHQLVGMLVRGKKDVYLKDEKSNTVIPGVMPKGNNGEICQKVEFLLKDFRFENLPNEYDEYETNAKMILPYAYLGKTGNQKLYALYLAFKTNRRVIFPEYPVKQGDITVIECYLDTRKKNNAIPDVKSYLIQKPKKKTETIEIRVYDLATGVYLYNILEYQNAGSIKDNELGNEKIEDKLYLAYYLTKEYYKKEVNEEEEIRISGIKFNKEGFDDSFEETLATIAPDENDRLKTLIDTFRRNTSLGASNPKPGRFIEILDMDEVRDIVRTERYV